ncbi:MAG: hypothetical protein EOL95_11415 [Bacteroidia bacterium]|nr:hypothetical protein [Bacteroidia bacterium]
MKPFQRKIITVLYILVSTIIILLPAIYNGYPLVTGDSGGYILMSKDLVPSVSRPLGYSLFINLFSWFNTLWSVAYFQSLLINIMLFWVIRTFLLGKKTIIVHLSIISFLSIFNSLGWYAGQIMTDIFVPITILAIYLFLVKKSIKWWEYILFGVLFCWSSAMHYSQLILIIVSAVFMIIVKLILNTRWEIYRLKVFIRASVMIFSALLSIVSLKIYISGFPDYLEYGGGKYVFLMGRLCESGILKDYLDENCEELNYPICKYKDNLPNTALEFVWTSKSPYMKDTLSFPEADKQYEPIVKDIVTTPKYWYRLFIKEGISQTVEQCYTMTIGHGLWKHKEGGSFYRLFEKVYPNETEKYVNSKQYKNELRFELINRINKIMLILSLALIIISFVVSRPPLNSILLTVVILGGYVLNAAISSNLANVSYRLGGRAAWLIIFLAGIMIAGVATKQVVLRKSKQSETEE